MSGIGPIASLPTGSLPAAPAGNNFVPPSGAAQFGGYAPALTSTGEIAPVRVSGVIREALVTASPTNLRASGIARETLASPSATALRTGLIIRETLISTSSIIFNEPVDVSKTTGYAVVLPNPDKVQSLSKLTGYVAIQGLQKLPKITGYAVMNDPTPRFIDLSKATGYAVVGLSRQRISKTTAYGVINTNPINRERLSKITGYAVMQAYPIVQLANMVKEPLTGGLGSVRFSFGAKEPLTGGNPIVRYSFSVKEPLTGGNPIVRCSMMGVEVLCGVPEEPFMLDPATRQLPGPTGPNALRGVTMTVVKNPNFSTRIALSVSGRETRTAFFDDPIWEFEYSYDYLPDRPKETGYSDLRTLEGFFMQRRGSYEPFLFQDPDDKFANNWQADIDGVTLTYRMRRNYGGFYERIGQLDTASAYEFWFRLTEGEAHTVPASPAFAITANESAVYRDNVAVTLADDTPLARVSELPGPMQYTVNVETGVYEFNVAQAGAAIKLFYEYDLIENTDYEILMPNKVVFPEAPPAGRALYGSFQFFFVCRFGEDATELEKFMDKLWELQTLSFRSVIE